jgi:hypothetical protein
VKAKEAKLRHIIALSILLFVGQSIAQKKDVNTKHEAKAAKLGDMDNYGDFLTAEGVWRADNLNEKTELLWNSVIRLECYKTGGRQLVGSESYCMEATAQIISGDFPDIEVHYFPVKRWDKEMVIAADSPTEVFPICFWTQITISLREKSIMATDTRKLSKGHEGFKNACQELPMAQTYHLMDKVEEITRRQLRTSQQKKPK